MQFVAGFLNASTTSATMTKISNSLAIVVLSASAFAQGCYDPNIGSSIGITQDSISTPQPIGFAFPFAGATYTDISISDHGIAFLSNAGVPAAPNPAAPFVYTPDPAGLVVNGPVLSPFWSDTIPGTGDIFINSTATELTVTWQDVTYFGAPVGTDYTFQMKLSDNGQVQFFYDTRVTNNSTFGGVSDNGVIGVSPGAPATLPAAVDLSTSPVTADDTTFELFAIANTFDMAGTGITMVPLSPGWFVTSLSCASTETYGTGCNSSPAHIYEIMATGTFDLAGTTITMLRTGNGYIALDSIPGVFITPSPTAQVVALGDDVEETVTLSAALPIPGGATTALSVSSNGQITLDATGNGTAFTPDVPTWLATSAPMVSPMWHDFQPDAAGSGTISFEEVGGIAIVSWNNVFNWGQTTGETFQVQFNLATGDITIVYDPIHNNVGTDYLVGLKAGGSQSDFGGNDLSAELAATVIVNDIEVQSLTLDSNAPALGSNWDLTTTNIDPVSPIAITFFGTAQGPGIPFSVIGLSAPGCSVWINTVVGTATALATAGAATTSIPVPNNTALIGGILTAQSICLTVQNPANLLASNGLQGNFGF